MSRVVMRERLKYARANEARDPRAIRWFISSLENIRSLFAAMLLLRRAERFRGEERVYTSTPSSSGLREHGRLRNRAHSRNVILRANKALEPAPCR